jgi:phosphatidylglycerol:prolipoprotein diacylglycerol transferase
MLPWIMIFGIKIPTYNLMLGCGLLGMIYCILRQISTDSDIRKSENLILAVIPFALFGGVITAFYFDVLFHGRELLTLKHQQIGFTFFGFLYGYIGALMLYSVFSGLQARFILNLLLPPLALAQGFGRIGCFLGGCCYGCPSNLGIAFPVGTLPWQRWGETKLFPVQLVEAILLFLLYLILCKITFRLRAVWYLVSISTVRFFLEFWRGDERGNLFFHGLSPAQTLSLGLLLLGCFLMTRAK